MPMVVDLHLQQLMVCCFPLTFKKFRATSVQNHQHPYRESTTTPHIPTSIIPCHNVLTNQQGFTLDGFNIAAAGNFSC